MNDLSLNLYRILAGAWRRRYAMLVPVLVFPLIGFFIGNFSAKLFHSHTSMLIQETAKMNPFLEDFAVSALLKERMATMQTLVHSRHILAAVAIKRGLIDEKMNSAKRDQVIERLSAALTVSMPGKDLIRIDFQSNSPVGMKETLEEVSQQFIENLLAPERSSMSDSTQFLHEQLEQRRHDIELAEEQLAQFKGRYASDLPELHVSNAGRLAQLKQSLAEKEAEIAGARKSLGSLDQQLSKTNPVVGRLETQIIELQGDLALLRARYTDKHSEVLGVKRKLKSLEEERQQALHNSQQNIDSGQLWQIASAVQSNDGKDEARGTLLVSQLESLQEARNHVTGLEEEILSIRGMIVEMERKSAGFGQLESNLVKLQRDLKVKRELYDELLNRYEMARITGSLSLFEQYKRVKVIDEPFEPGGPSNLPLVLYIVAGLFGGLFLGAGLALMLEFMDNSIRYRSQLEQLTGLPVLGSIQPLPGSRT